MGCPHVAKIAQSLRAPAAGTPVFKDECTLCFDSPHTKGGLDVCLSCFSGGCTSLAGGRHALLHWKKHPQHALAVNIQLTPRAVSPAHRDGSGPPPAKITKLAIAAEPTEADTHETAWTVRCFACGDGKDALALGDAEADPVREHVAAILRANSSARQSDIKAWELETKPCKHVTAHAADASATRHSPGQTCSACSSTDNLWLCLQCGALGCGRKHHDGSGGNGHALAHFDATGHALAVKLGTITPEGSADIYCYSCNDEVADPALGKHLEPFGINIQTQERTSKTLAELQLDMNLQFDFSMVTEDGKQLPPVAGPWLTGLRNLGNSCYIASAVQVIASVDAIQERYLGWGAAHVESCDESAPECFHCQMHKLVAGIGSGRYAGPDSGVSPGMFKRLVGRGHADFASMRQQDAAEFLAFLLDMLEQREKPFGANSALPLQFSVRRRLECTQCHGVRYAVEPASTMLHAPVPLPAEGNVTPLVACLDAWAAPTRLEFRCPRCDSSTMAESAPRLASRPRYVAIVAQRFIFENWTPKKLGVAISAPLVEQVDLAPYFGEPLGAGGALPGETLLPESESSSAPAAAEVDPEALAQLASMGFPESRCRAALEATRGGGAEAAMNWLLEHLDDPEPTPAAAPAPASAGVAALADMGFSELQAKVALKENGGDLERAVNWLFQNSDREFTEADLAPASSAASTLPENPNRSTLYRLFAVISHRGTSAHCGHYVAHIRKTVDGASHWVLFNDDKVVLADDFSTSDGYVYLLEQI